MSQSNEPLFMPKRDLHIGGLGPASGGTLADHYLDTGGEDSEDWGGPNDWIERARGALRDADRFVHESPWRALGMVAAVSFVAGLVFKRRT